MKDAVLRALRTFGLGPFKARDFAERLGYSEGYVRNVISEAVASGEVLAYVSDEDKRVKVYRINSSIIRKAILKGGEEKKNIIEALGLEGEYSGAYVALLNGEVVDYDDDLYALSGRVFANYGLDEVVVTNVGVPRKIITMEL